MNAPSTRSVLISGASIAGPTLAYWLQRAGFEVTVVERAPTLRGGGYPIDLRAVAVDVVERMGVLADLQQLKIETESGTFVDSDGKVIRTLSLEAIAGNTASRDVEVPRGNLAGLLWGLTKDDVEYVFGDVIAAIDEHEDGIEVDLQRGGHRRFDLVIGADGLHSNVRDLVFGSESRYDKYLGWCYAACSAPNTLGLSNGGMTYNTPGHMATLFAVGDLPERVYAFLAYSTPKPSSEQVRDIDFHRRQVAERFAGARWEIPMMLESLRTADDAFCDAVMQIRMPGWTKGRVALVGDAAYAPSFLSGQGSSIAVVGAYVLAGELARTADHREAFAAYEARMRSFVEQNQDIALGNTGICVDSAAQLWVRNRVMALLPLLSRIGVTKLAGGKVKKAASAIDLPDYPWALPSAA